MASNDSRVDLSSAERGISPERVAQALQRAAERPRVAVFVDREGLGDALLKIPFLRAVRRAFPAHSIWWIASHQTAMADDLAPFVGNLIDEVFPYADLTSPARAIAPRLRRLPSFDLVFDARTRVATVLLTRLLIKHRGFYACLPGYLFSDRLPRGRWMRPRGIAARLLTMVEAATGRPADWRGTFAVDAAAEALAAKRLPGGARYIGLAPGSREARKNWPLEQFIELARQLSANGYTPAFLIGPQEREWLARLHAALPQAVFPEAEPVDPAQGLPRLALAIALFQRLAAAVANDSGVGHLLGAVGTPLVSLFGPTDPARWAPFSDRCIVVRAQDFGSPAIESIPVEAVREALGRLVTA
jgi:ADP-heptose:LPS heptosyltransferase